MARGTPVYAQVFTRHGLSASQKLRSFPTSHGPNVQDECVASRSARQRRSRCPPPACRKCAATHGRTKTSPFHPSESLRTRSLFAPPKAFDNLLPLYLPPSLHVCIVLASLTFQLLLGRMRRGWRKLRGGLGARGCGQAAAAASACRIRLASSCRCAVPSGCTQSGRIRIGSIISK